MQDVHATLFQTMKVNKTDARHYNTFFEDSLNTDISDANGHLHHQLVVT